MKRIFVSGMMHESNSFNPILCGEEYFIVTSGKELLDIPQSNNSMSGIIHYLKDKDVEIIPGYFATAVPNGEVDRGFYESLKKKILDVAVEEHKKAPFDGIALALHGSMRVKEIGDAEGYLMEELRQLIPDVPTFCALDMHTTMTERMYRNCEGFVGFKHAPHIDRYETGLHAARMLMETLEKGTRPYSAWVKVPILIAGEQSSTTVEPMYSMEDELREMEKRDDILAASYLMGFPWCDNKDSSCAVSVVGWDEEKACEEAVRLAQAMWDRRHEFCFQTETYHNKEAIDKVFEGVKNASAEDLPIYLSDSGDNPTAGSTSDCTGLLKMFMEDSRTDELKSPVLYGGIYDPWAVEACKGKVGQEIEITFGARYDTKSSEPITAKGTVVSFVEGWDKFSGPGDVCLFRSNGVDIVLSQNHIGYGNPDIFTDLGRDPHDADVVVTKLGYLTNDQAMIAKRSIMALSSGSTNEDLKSLDYKLVPRPIFPLEDDFGYRAKDNLMK